MVYFTAIVYTEDEFQIKFREKILKKATWLNLVSIYFILLTDLIYI